MVPMRTRTPQLGFAWLLVSSLVVASTGGSGCGRIGFEVQPQTEDGGPDAAADASITDATAFDAPATDAEPSDAEPPDAGASGPIVVVNTTSDVSDGATSSIAALQSNPGADGKISLREAIEATNATPNGAEVDAIHFQIEEPLVAGAHTIVVSAGGLPHITDAVLIDGQTDSDFAGTPIIELDGSNTSYRDGLFLAVGSDGTTIRGLVINRFATGSGIEIESNANTVANCYIGTNAAGTLPLDVLEGVFVGGNGNAIIDNILGGASEEGIDTNTGGNTIIRGNYIGTNASNANLGNQWGIVLWRNHTGAMVGGTGAGDGNVVAHSGDTGVVVLDDTTGHSILGNAIYANATMNLDLGVDGVTANDPGDGDTGNNNLQNYPTLSSASTDTVSTISIDGSLNSTASTTFRVEFFASANPGREAERFLGATTVITNGGGNANFSANLTAVVPAGEYITSTATVDLGGGSYGDTSELSDTVTAM